MRLPSSAEDMKRLRLERIARQLRSLEDELAELKQPSLAVRTGAIAQAVELEIERGDRQ